VRKLSKTGRVRHLQAGEKKSQNKTRLKKQSLLAYTANKVTEAPVPGWPAWPWQPTMHRGCDGGEAPRVVTSYRVTRRRRELNRARFSPVSPNPIRRILEKYTARVVAVVLWKKYRTPYHSSITFVVRTFRYCNSEPSQHS